MRELTLEEMRMVTGGLVKQDMFDERILRNMEVMGQYGFDAKTPSGGGNKAPGGSDSLTKAADAIGSIIGGLVGGVVTGVCTAAAKGVVAQAACGVAGNTAGNLTTPAASAVANAVLHLGGQPGDYACGKIGICH